MKLTLSDEERARRRKHRDAITTKESQSKGGRAAGKIAAEKSGHLDSIRTPESTSKGGRIGGLVGARNGHLASIKTRETCSKGGRATCHKRHHVMKAITNPNCSFCIGLEFLNEPTPRPLGGGEVTGLEETTHV